MFNIIQKTKDAEIVVLTPLRTTDSICKELKKGLKKNRVPYDWVSYASEANCPSNANLAFDNYLHEFKKVPPYIIKLDNDIEPDAHLLDNLWETLKKSSDNVAYAYCAFEIYGVKNLKFPAKEFSIKEMLIQNYISSNSLIKWKPFRIINGFNCNKSMERLCDWAMWLNLLDKGYIGTPSPGFFKTELKESGIGNRGLEDYYSKYRLILKELVEPLREKIKSGDFGYGCR